jgi:hypothetical protein
MVLFPDEGILFIINSKRMHNKIENLVTDFDYIAQVSMNTAYAAFVFSVKNIDRQENENLFQSIIQQYAEKLKQTLEQTALEFIFNNRYLPTIDWLHKRVFFMIGQYRQEFLQQAKVM